jgi:predicted RNA-binding protein YlxR (DUF448 family)
VVQPKTGLVRFVIGPDHVLIPDLLEKLPGRGIWVSPDRDAMAKAIKQNLFARSAKTPLTIPDGLIDQIETGLAHRLTHLISLSRKSGQAVAGFEKVKDWLATQKIGALLQASDGSVRGKAKLWTPQGARYFSVLTAQELGLAFGRETVIHCALAAGGLSSRVVEVAEKVQKLRRTNGDIPAGKDERNA